MSNILITSTNRVDDATSITADDEVAGLPIANVQDRQITKVFRNTQNTAQIDVNFGQGRVIDVVAVIRHNMTQTSKIRVRLSTVSDFSTTVYDSGTVNAWPVVEEFGALPWGVFNWGGFISTTEAVDYTISSFALPTTSVVAQYLRIDLTDTDSTDGYIQVGRIIAAPAYRPSINMAFGVEFEFVDESRVTKSRGGQTFIDEVERFRRMRFELLNIPENEIFSNVFNSIDRRRGIVEDLLVIPQPDDNTTWITQNIYGRLTSTNPITNTQLERYGRLIEIEELI